LRLDAIKEMYLLLVLDCQYRNLLEIYGYYSSYMLTEAASIKINNPTIIFKTTCSSPLGEEQKEVVIIYTNDNDYFDIIDILNPNEDMSKYTECKSIVKKITPI
jgi:hypothetical protein